MQRLMSMKQVCDLTSLSRATIYRKVDDGTFPAPIALGDRKRNKLGQLTGRIAFIAELVEKWITDRIRAARITRPIP